FLNSESRSSYSSFGSSVCCNCRFVSGSSDFFGSCQPCACSFNNGRRAGDPSFNYCSSIGANTVTHTLSFIQSSLSLSSAYNAIVITRYILRLHRRISFEHFGTISHSCCFGSLGSFQLSQSRHLSGQTTTFQSRESRINTCN